MKKLLYTLAIAGTLLAPFSTAPLAHATSTKHNTNTSDCKVSVVGASNSVGKSDSRFTYDATTGIVSAKVIVAGKNDCTKTVSIASWRAPYGAKGFTPYSAQTLFDAKTVTLPVGTHAVSVKTDACKYQVDLLYGSDTTVNGTPEYPAEQKLGWVQSGTKVCEKAVTPAETPSPTPTPTPAAPVTAPVTPAGVGGAAEPVTLPSVGAGSIVALFGLTTSIATAVHHLVSRRGTAR